MDRKEYFEILNKNVLKRAEIADLITKGGIIDGVKYSAKECDMIFFKQCQDDIFFWFDYFAWTQNTKGFTALEGEAVPFYLFNYQREFVASIWESITRGRKPIFERGLEPLDIFVEKSRQMGVSWMVMAVFVYGFTYHNLGFSAISRTETEVDNNTVDSLFGKIRFMMSFLPKSHTPAGFLKQKGTSCNAHMLVTRTDGQGNISGYTANTDAARGSTKHAIFLDEMAFMQNAKAINMAVANATPVRIFNSTPNGEQGEFYNMRKIAYNGGIKCFRLYWRENPLYDDAWYAKECSRMTPEQISREMDISYAGSVTGRVYPMFGPPVVKFDDTVEYDYNLPLYCSIDNSHGGGDPHAVVLFQKNKLGNITVLDSCQTKSYVSVNDMADMLAKRIPSGTDMGDDVYRFYEYYKTLKTPIFISDPYDTDSAMNDTSIRKIYAERGIQLNIPRMKNGMYGKIAEQVRLVTINLNRVTVKYNSDEPTTNAQFVWAMKNCKYPGKENDSGVFMPASNKPIHDDTSHHRTSFEYGITYLIADEEQEEFTKYREMRPKKQQFIFNTLTGQYS